MQGSHNGYLKRFNKIIKRKLIIDAEKSFLSGEDSIISTKNISKKIFYHIRFHLMPGITHNLTNNKKILYLKLLLVICGYLNPNQYF